MDKSIYELTEIIEEQRELLEKKDSLICKLLNENAEKENMINVLMSEFKE